MKIRSIVLLAILITVAAMVCGCDKKKSVINRLIAVSPDEKIIAFVAGPKAHDNYWPEQGKENLYILDRAQGNVFAVNLPGELSARSLGWRPDKNPPELYTTVTSKEAKFERKLLRIVVQKDKAIVETCPCQIKFDIDNALSWSPDGNHLSIALLSQIVFSHDGGKTLIDSGIGGFSAGIPFWVNNETVYFMDGNYLIEITATNQSAEIKRVVAFGSGNNIYLFGTMNGTPVYSVDTNMYCGDKLLLKTEKHVRKGFVNDYYAAFSVNPSTDENYILVVDTKGNIVRKKSFAKDWLLTGISPSKGVVYLLSEFSSIYQYNFEDDTVTMIYDCPFCSRIQLREDKQEMSSQ
jgi:hypothetical protein